MHIYTPNYIDNITKILIYFPLKYEPFKFIFSILSVGKGEFYKLGFVVLELALLCGRYLELVETNQPSLCKGRGTTKWWKDCFGRHFRLYKIYSIYDVGNEHCSFLYL